MALTISSIVLTVTFGAWGLVVAYRSRYYPARITYVHGTLAPLFEAVVSDLPQLQLRMSFQGGSLSGRAAVLRGAFQNRGHKDLTASMVDSPLTIRLVSGYRWLSVGDITASPRLQPKITIQESHSDTAVVSFGQLFRRGEWLAFSALLEMDPDRPVGFPLLFEHRIADLRPIERAKARARWSLSTRFLIFLVLGLPFFLALTDPGISPQTTAWILPRVAPIAHYIDIHEKRVGLFFFCLWAAMNGYFVLSALYERFRSSPDPGLPPEFRAT